MKASDLLVQCLEREGVDTVFALPGEENADVTFSLEKSSIRVVLTRHEQGAGFMANAWGRLKGTPAICLATLGPGATNLVTPVAEGNMDHAPIIALTGQGATSRLHKESHQIINVEDMFLPVTKWAASVRTPQSIPELVRKAVRVARAEKPGAVLLELPEDIAGMDVDSAPLTPHRFFRPTADASIIADAAERIAAARAPLIIAGNGAIRTRASRALRVLCDQTGIGVLSTFMGKGAVDKDAPYCLYTIGLSQKDIVHRAVEEADLVITVGYDMVEYPPQLWNVRGEQNLVHLDFYPAEIDAHYQPACEVVGDIAGSLELLTDALAKRDDLGFDFSVQRAVRDEMAGELARHADDTGEAPVRPQKAVADLRAALGPDDILLSGVGAHKMWIARHYHCHSPNTCLIPNGFCSMGGAFPGAIGAKLAMPDRKVVAVCGDGDFLMNVQEMETARRLDLDLVVLVWVDGGYGLIAWKQENEEGRHTPLSFGNPDWNGLAASFGWHGHAVTQAEELLPTLRKALDEAGPSLVSLPIDYRENRLLTERLGHIDMRI
ncbi:MAG: acetolactate synthase large subunit [Pseudomonadota bacterium]